MLKAVVQALIASFTSVTSATWFRGGNGTAAAPTFSFTNFSNTGFYEATQAGAPSIAWTSAGTTYGTLGVGIALNSGVQINWTNGAVPGSVDLSIGRDAANILYVKNGTNAQTFRVYGTTTGPVYGALRNDGAATYLESNSGIIRVAPGTSNSVYFSANVMAPITNGTCQLGVSANGFSKIYFDYTNTAPGTTGNRTINKASGRVNIAAAGTTVTVTNSLVTAASQIFCAILTNDATARINNVVPAAGSFVINITACTAEVAICFFVVNTD